MTKPFLYVLFVGSAFLFSVTEFLATGAVQPYSLFSVVHVFVLALLVLWWLRLDAGDGHRSGPLMKVLAISFPPISLPAHFFRTRGAKGGFMATAGMLGLIFLFGVSGALGEYAIEIIYP